jgi:hypothetical protein
MFSFNFSLSSLTLFPLLATGVIDTSGKLPLVLLIPVAISTGVVDTGGAL